MTTETQTELQKIKQTIDLLMTCLLRIQDEQQTELDAFLSDGEADKIQERIILTTQAYMSLDSAANIIDKTISL